MNTTMKRIAFCLTILVAGCSMMSKPANEGIADASITSGVQANLAAEPQLHPYAIAVKTDDGVVHLSGNVATGGERDTAEKIALGSHGVVRVDNYIQFGTLPALVVTQ
jgi:osmotically-inducible protein OsmY